MNSSSLLREITLKFRHTQTAVNWVKWDEKAQEGMGRWCAGCSRGSRQGEVLKGQRGRRAESKGWQTAGKFRQEPGYTGRSKACLFLRINGCQQRILPRGWFTRERSFWQSGCGQETRWGTMNFLPQGH